VQNNLISTQEVAKMLNVTETTIKRWADENIIRCVKTPGGHRKFSLDEIVRFAEANGYEIAGSHPPPMNPAQLEELEIGVLTKNYRRIAKVFREEALQADREGMFSLLLYLYKHQISLTVIVDEIMRPAFEFIGSQWVEGKLEISQEHAASQAATESLIRMMPQLHQKESNGLSVLCACLEDEFHETGLRGLAYSLECEGWKVQYTGSNTPIETIDSFVRAARPDLVCVSVTIVQRPEEFIKGIKRLASVVHSYRGKLIIGGSYSEMLDQSEINCDHIAQSIRDAVGYTREAFHLKPGPKKKSTRKDELQKARTIQSITNQ